MVFYFSGTGNTEWAARRLAESLGEPLVQMNDWILLSCPRMAATGLCPALRPANEFL